MVDIGTNYKYDTQVNNCYKYTTDKVDASLLSNRPMRLVTKTPFTKRNVVSYGLMVYAMDSHRWLIVRRKHSAEFVLIMKGNYKPVHLLFLLSRITITEKDIIKECIKSKNIFTYVYKDIFHNYIDTDYKYSLVRFMENRHFISGIIDKVYCGNLNWTWPKGRPDGGPNKEDGYSCALREFEEEASIALPEPIYKSPIPYSDCFRSVIGRTIETRCWLYIIDKEISVPKVLDDNHEICNRKWLSTIEIMENLEGGQLKMLTECMPIVTKYVSTI